MHLAVDGYGGDPEKLKDVDLVHQFLDEYPDAIGMTKIVPPQVYTYQGQKPGDWGVSGFVLIAEMVDLLFPVQQVLIPKQIIHKIAIMLLLNLTSLPCWQNWKPIQFNLIALALK